MQDLTPCREREAVALKFDMFVFAPNSTFGNYKAACEPLLNL
jgi:hypothetical protein